MSCTKRHVLGPYGHTDFFDRAMGLLTPWSFVPHHILSYDDEMSYTQRIYNVILSLYDWWFRSWIVSSRQNDIARRYFNHLVGKCFKKAILFNVQCSCTLLIQEMVKSCHRSKSYIEASR